MKRLAAIILALLLSFSLCACGKSFSQVELQDTMDIPENGIIEKAIIKTIKEENAIAGFRGESNGILYEWTVFGSDISEPCEVCLAVDIDSGDDGVSVSFSQGEPFGFPMLLSVYLNEQWDSFGAAAYQGEKAVYSVSLTGRENTILNLAVNDVLGDFVIRPDDPETDAAEAPLPENSEIEKEKPARRQDKNGYLSAAHGRDEQVYFGSVAAKFVEQGKETSGRAYSDGSARERDSYLTDPVPQGKPMPVEPENQEINEEKSLSCTFSIECSTILNNLSELDEDKLEIVPSNGVILKKYKAKFYEGESVFDVLQRVCEENDIHLESSWTPIYNSAYIEGIANLYEFDCGSLSGWMYRVNGWYPNYGCSRYQLAQGDKVEWRYTCDLGSDIGGRNFG